MLYTGYMKARLAIFHGPKWLIMPLLTLIGLFIVTSITFALPGRLASPKLVASQTSTKPKPTIEAPSPSSSTPASTDKPPTTPAPTPPPASTSNCNTSLTHVDPTSIDVLVNKKHCLVPLSYAPSDLVEVDGALISAKAADDFAALYQAAANAGQPLAVTSSYRSYYTQITTYNYWISISGQAGADQYSARPGFSEHQTGLAIDLGAGGLELSNFDGSSQAAWLAANAYKYGFIERYPAGYESITGYEAESWHYRYIGIAAATDMYTHGIKTLEQYWGLDGGDYQ